MQERSDKGTKRLILASSSPRRRDLLKQIGLTFDVIPSTVPEAWEPGDSPQNVSRQLALDKASDVAAGFSSGIVIGADTLVVQDGTILGKPESTEEAVHILRKLSGKSHEVITAVTLIDAETGRSETDDETTRVFFRKIADDEIRAYVATREPMDKAGAYGIQEKGILFVQRVEGCYTNVVGLPLVKLAEMLARMDFRLF